MWRGILILLADILNNGVMIKFFSGEGLWTKIIVYKLNSNILRLSYLDNNSEIRALIII